MILQESTTPDPVGRHWRMQDLEYGVKIYRDACGTNAVLAELLDRSHQSSPNRRLANTGPALIHLSAGDASAR